MGKFDTFIQNKGLRYLRLRAILKILEKLPGGTILDIGCMDDYFIKRLSPKFDYFGIDDNPLCKHPKISKISVEKLPKNKKYDIVLCTEVLEHLNDPVAAMRALKRLSKRFILISVPNEPYFALFRLFFPVEGHLWTIYPWTLKRHFGKPIHTKLTCFNRTYIALWDLRKKNQKP